MVKNLSSELFVHALSNVSNAPKVKRQAPRLSFDVYHPDTFIKKGELLFDCKSSI